MGLSMTTDLNDKQGLDPMKLYEALVVNNNDNESHPDKMMMGRIQARIAIIFDGIPDADLPWAVPQWAHNDGAHALSGFFSVPKVGSKVFLRFQQGKASFPVYMGYHSDVVTQQEEIKHNYPDRAMIRFQNKAMLIVDTKSNAMYLRNPGNMRIFIDGNVEMQINGSVDEVVHGDVRRVIKGNLDEFIHGNVHREIDGTLDETIVKDVKRTMKANLDEEVTSNRQYHTGGNQEAGIDGHLRQYSGGASNYEAGGNMVIEAPMIYENCGMGQGKPAAPKVPVIPVPVIFHKWPGVPGSAKGTNTRNAATVQSAAKQCPTYAADTTPATVHAEIAVPAEIDGDA